MALTWRKLAYEDDVILDTIADANSILYAVADNTPAALAMAASTIAARLGTGNIVAATPTEIRTLLNVASGADVTGSNAPQAHAASHQNAGGDEISVIGLSGLLADDQHVLDTEVTAVITATPLNDLATAIGAIDCGEQQLQDAIIHTVADATALAALANPTIGKLAFQTDTLSAYICTATI